MTGVQLGLLVASLVVHSEPWVLPIPQESQTQAQADCSGDACPLLFTIPPEPRAGRILMMAMVFNLPAVFLGAFLELAAILIHFPHPHGEPALLGFSAVFVPLIWYRVGRWIDDLVKGGTAGEPAQLTAKALWRSVARAIAWFLFVLMLLSFLTESRRESNATKFEAMTVILWTGAYLGGGLLGDRRRKARLRASVG
jgi:hypothetical protein